MISLKPVLLTLQEVALSALELTGLGLLKRLLQIYGELHGSNVSVSKVWIEQNADGETSYE